MSWGTLYEIHLLDLEWSIRQFKVSKLSAVEISLWTMTRVSVLLVSLRADLLVELPADLKIS